MCEFVDCKYDYNSFVIRTLKTIKENVYLTILIELNNIFRSFFFVDSFACDIRKSLIIFDVNIMNN